MTFTGLRFPTDQSVTAVYMGQSTTDVVVNSETSAVATFANGVPYSVYDDLKLPQLEFEDGKGVIRITYNFLTFLENDFEVTSASTTELQVGYGGGLEYTVTKDNIYATLLEEINDISVCGNPCELDHDKSNAQQAVCTVASLSTTYSVAEYDIQSPHILTGNFTSQLDWETDEEIKKVYDGKPTTRYGNTASDCYLQLELKDEHVGVLDSAKIFINDLNTNKTPFNGNLVLQGNDGGEGSEWVDIWAIDASVHDGWNQKEFESDKPAYHIYRWKGSATGACVLGEVQFIGYELVQEDSDTKSCVPKLKMGSVIAELSPVVYSAAKTPFISNIAPNYGRVSGGDSVTFNGGGFVDGDTTIMLDGIECTSTSITATTVICTTGDKPLEIGDPSIDIFVSSKGLAVTGGNIFRYVSFWSESTTWGGDAPPQLGEAVQIPKGRNLLVDVDSVPQLSFVLVEGSLIFAPDADENHHRTFDAGYIFIKHGYMEVGTDANPYTSKITITMHGDVSTPALPTFGNKVIGVHMGELHMVGKERKVTWT